MSRSDCGIALGEIGGSAVRILFEDVIQNLFKNKAKRIKKNELLVFITPKIVMDKNFTSP
jgi:hypothetical protein